MRITKITIGAFAIACMFLLAAQLWAEEGVFEIQGAVTIVPDSGHARLLMKPEVGFPDTTMTIDWATLDLWVSPQTEDTTYISIRIYPIITDWNPETATWNSPWTNPGGDIDDISYAEYAVSIPEEQAIQVDLTDLCMRWADGRLPYYGFVIDISESSLAGVDFLNGDGGTGPLAKLTVAYNRIAEE